MITSLNKKREMTKPKVIKKVEEKRNNDKNNSNKSSGKLIRTLERKNIFDDLKKKMRW